MTFVNGNDVLNPWLVFQRPWLDSMAQQRFLWRVAPALRDALRTPDMRRGFRAAAGLVANSTNTAAILNSVHLGFSDRTVVIPPGVADDFSQEHEPRNRSGLLLTVARLERACYREADLFIMAARARRNDVEGFGIVYLEAAAAGVPIICSAAGGATDAVRDGVRGIVLDGSEPGDIAAGIRRFLNERERFDPAGVRGFAEEFRWPRIAERVRAELARASRSARRSPANGDAVTPSARHSTGR